jgi:hypothetical protein
MAEFIPSYTITEFRKLKAHELRRLKSAEIISDGEYLFTFVNPQTDYIRKHVEYLCLSGNNVSGESLEQIIEQEVVA